MRRPLLFALLGALAAASTAGCDDSSRTLAPQPDARPPNDAGQRLDQGPDADVALDAGDADVADDADVQVDAEPDMAPPVPGPDDASQMVVLSRRGASQVAWLADGMLYAAHLSDAGEALEARPLFAVDDPLPAPLLAGRTDVAPAWLLVPNGPDAAYQAYDITLDAPEAVETHIYPPARAVAAEGHLLLIGRSGPEADAPVAWLRVEVPAEPEPVDPDADAAVEEAGPVDPRVLDLRGVPSVTGASASLAGTVLAFETGICALMRNAQLGGEWLCNGLPDARLVGALDSLFFVAQRPDGIAAWSALPGHASQPDAEQDRLLLAPAATLVEWLPAINGTRVARAQDHLCAVGRAACREAADCGPDQACVDATCLPNACEADADCGDEQRCGDGVCHVRCADDTACAPGQICADGGCRDTACDPQAATCAPGRICTPSEGVWLFEDHQARRLEWPAGDRSGAVYFGRGKPFGIRWSPEDGAPIVEALRTLAYARVPQIDLPQCNAPVQPEDCEGIDRDCDGEARGGRCCLISQELTTTNIATELEGRWHVALGDNRLMLVAVTDGQAELHTFRAGTENNGISVAVARWPAIGAVQLMANEESRLAAVATTDAGAETLLWYVGPEGLTIEPGAVPVASRSELPCSPVLGLELLRAGAPGPTARVHCADASYAIDALGVASAIVPRPEGDPVRWARRRAMGFNDLWLVARGDDYALELWRRTADGYVVADDITLPNNVLLLSAEDRALPIQTPRVVGGWTARVVDETQLEILQSDGTWSRAPATRWPTAARLSDHEPMAVTQGYASAPDGDTLLNLWFHALGPKDPYWGHFRRSNPADTRASENQGVELGDYPVTAFSSPVPVVASGSGNTAIQTQVTACEPTP
jgi:hypothetical protein